MSIAIISVAIVVTAVISGVIGMAGGVLLMLVYLAVLPVPVAMVLHGVTQAAANGYRAWLLHRHIPWRIMPFYLSGAIAAAVLFRLFGFVPDKALICIAMGLVPWLARLVPVLGRLSIEHVPTAMASGLLVTGAQLLAGTSGPLLDVFYHRSRLTRHAIVAGKALTQSAGHLLKLGYYAGFLTTAHADLLPWWIYPLAVVLAMAGTRCGVWLLRRLSESRFRRISDVIILVLATFSILAGIRLLWLAE